MKNRQAREVILRDLNVDYSPTEIIWPIGQDIEELKELCPQCNGERTLMPCGECNGTGKVTTDIRMKWVVYEEFKPTKIMIGVDTQKPEGSVTILLSHEKSTKVYSQDQCFSSKEEANLMCEVLNTPQDK